MNNWQVEYRSDNGYSCSCCRKEWEDAREFETWDKAVEWAFSREISHDLKWGGFEIIGIRPMSSLFSWEYVKELHAGFYDKMLSDHQDEVTKKEAEEKACAQARKRKAELVELERLKEKYE
jgi:hypothetical protein